jgi:NADH-quinone oxidoreductase subunit G
MTSGGVSVYDCMDSDAVLVVGSHLSEENPVTDYIVRRTTNFKFINVLVASPRAMKLDKSANLTVRHNPASEGALLGAVVMALAEKNPSKLADFTPLRALEGRAAELTAASGVTSAEIDDLATRLAGSESVSIIAGTEFLRYPEGTGGLAMIKDALRAMGKEVRVLPVLDRSNQRGAWDMGVHPGFAPGYRETRRGLGTTGMLSAAAEGRLDAMYVAGADIAALHRDGDFAREALGKLRFLVVQDIFLTDTARLAHVVLPAAAWAEKNGTVTNQEGRVQKITRLLPPPGKARTDFGIFRSVGRLFDKSFGATPDETFKEIRLQNMMYQDVSLEFNNKKNKHNELDVREALVEGSSNRVRSSGAGAAATPSAPTATERPFALMTGNHFFHGGTYSTKSEILMSITKGEQVEISAEDAAELGLREGENVKVTGEHHEATLQLKVVEGSKRGVLFIPENFPGVSVNRFYRAGAPLPRVGIRRA